MCFFYEGTLAISQNCHDLSVDWRGKVKYKSGKEKRVQEPFDVKDEELIPIVMKLIVDEKVLKILKIH